VASSKSRQRKLERERYDRKMARLAQQQRRKRQIQAGVGVFLVVALIGLGTAWLAGVFEPEEPAVTQPPLCTWLPRNPADHPDKVDVGTPPQDPATSGTRAITMDLDAGDAGAGQVQVQMDIASDPCGAASLEYLAAQGFFDDTTCHALDTELGALRCGSPNGTELGGPAYAFYGENLPLPPATGAPEGEEPPATYPAGTVAYADTTGENGSQFLIFYEDATPESPLYSIIGTVTGGLDVVEGIAEAGVEDGSTTPAEEVRIRTLTVADAAAAPVQ
jgi:peptidyl-prolyl cis-trans isomerase B (cyclophilin B)